MSLLLALQAAPAEHQLSPGGFANVNAFGEPSLAATLAPAGHANITLFGVPALNATLAPAGFANVTAFGRPTLQVEHTLRQAGFENIALFGQPTLELPVERVIDGSGLIIIRKGKKRRQEPRPRARLPEDIAREQREEKRYLAELEKKNKAAPPQPSTAALADAPSQEGAGQGDAAAVPALPDALARAVSAEQVIARARASSAEAIARSKAEEKRRTALLLLALD